MVAHLTFFLADGKFMPGECYAGRLSFIDIPTLKEHPRRFLVGNALVFKVFIEVRNWLSMQVGKFCAGSQLECEVSYS